MKNIRQAVQKTLAQYEPKAIEARGFLGLSDGTIDVPGKSHMVYVRLWNGEIVEAFNNHNVPPMPGLAVKVLYRLRHYEVDLVDVYDQPVFRGLPDGAEDELQWPGSHTLYLRPEQFLPGLVYPSEGLIVYVAGGRIPLSAGGFVTIPAQTVDLSSYVPASDALWATLELLEDGSIGVETGGAQDSVGELLESEIPTSGSGFPLAAIKLFNGQTEIAHGAYGSNIVDLRFFQRGGGSSGSITVEEQDGTPSVSAVTKIKVSNGSLTDDGGGVVSLQTGGSAPSWGAITGTLSDQTDLQSALDGKAASSHTHDDRYYTESESDALLDDKADTEHEHAGGDITSGTLDGDRLPALSTSKRGGAPATGTPSGKFLRDDDSWAAAVTETAVAARVYNNADINIPDSTNTTLTFNSEDFDDGDLHSTITNTGRLTAPTDGLYLIGAIVGFATNTMGIRLVRILLNGTNRAQASQNPISGTWTVMPVVTLLELSAGDYVECEVYQTSGGTLAVKSNATTTPVFWMALVSVTSGLSGATYNFDSAAQTLGATQNRNTTSSFTYQQQSILVTRPIKLEAIHVYIRTSGNYTVTLSTSEGTTLATKALTSVTGGAVVEFALTSFVILEPGTYTIKINSDGGSVLWSDYNSAHDQFYGAFTLAGGIFYGTSQYNYRAPIQLEFYDSSLNLA